MTNIDIYLVVMPAVVAVCTVISLVQTKRSAARIHTSLDRIEIKLASIEGCLDRVRE
jgi:hypothetical protein